MYVKVLPKNNLVKALSTEFWSAGSSRFDLFADDTKVRKNDRSFLVYLENVLYISIFKQIVTLLGLINIEYPAFIF